MTLLVLQKMQRRRCNNTTLLLRLRQSWLFIRGSWKKQKVHLRLLKVHFRN